MEQALAQTGGAPFFGNFMKTLEARRTDVIEKLLQAPEGQGDLLRGEARAYDYIIKAHKRAQTK
jgi:hypothetical protein